MYQYVYMYNVCVVCHKDSLHALHNVCTCTNVHVYWLLHMLLIIRLLLFPGCGDFTLRSVMSLPDPCPLPDKLKKRSLNEKEKLIYAPMTGVGGIVYDKVKIMMTQRYFVDTDYNSVVFL